MEEGGNVAYPQNFDLADLPRSFGDIFSGRAFSGGGQTLVLSLAPGTRISNFQIRFTEPFVFDTPWQFDGEIFRNRRRFDSFVSERTGFGMAVGRHLDRDLGIKDDFIMTTGYRFEVVDFRDALDDVDITVPLPPLREEDTLRINSLRQSFRYASWDDRLLTTRGFESEVSAQLAGGPLGGNQDFVKFEASGEIGIPVYGVATRHLRQARPTVIAARPGPS